MSMINTIVKYIMCGLSPWTHFKIKFKCCLNILDKLLMLYKANNKSHLSEFNKYFV